MAGPKKTGEERIDAGFRAVHMASFVLLGKLITIILTGIALIVVTRVLGPSQYGIYTLAMAVVGVFGSAGYFGIGTAMNKFISEYRHLNKKNEINAVVSNSLLLLFVFGIIFSGLCFVSAQIVATDVLHNSGIAYVIEVASIYILTSMLFGAFYDALLGFGQGRYVAVIAAVQSVLQSVVSIYLAFLGFGPYAPIAGLIVGFLFGFAVAFYIVIKRNKVELVRPTLEWLHKLFRFSAPVTLSTIASNFVGNFSIAFLGYFVLPMIIGNVGVAIRVSSLIDVVSGSISFALLPAFSSALVNKNLKAHIGKIYSYSVYLGTAILGPILFYLAVFSKPFSFVVFGSSYTFAPTYIIFVTLGMLLGLSSTYGNTLLISANRVKDAFKYNFIGAVAMLILVLTLVPVFGTIAFVIINFIISPIILNYLFLKDIKRIFKPDMRVGKLARLVVADIIVSAIASSAYFFFGGNYTLLLIVAAAIFIILYPIVAVLLSGMERSDIETLKLVSGRVPIVGKIMHVIMDYANMVAR